MTRTNAMFVLLAVLTGGCGNPNPIGEIDAFIASQKIDKNAPEWRTKLPKPPKLAFDSKSYLWKLETSKGEIKVRFLPDVAPMHVSSTIYLTRIGFYDGLTFHRVIPGFMAQGGCPLGTGTGNPGYLYDGEFAYGTIHDRGGMLSMANQSLPNTDGSQFFLTFTATPHLNGKHTIFGGVVSGMDTLRAFEAAGTPGGQPKERLVINKASILVE